jgi:hypothetical protein
MTTLPEIIDVLVDYGIFTHYLPFLLVFVLFYAILIKTKIFGEDRRIAFLIALIASLYVMTMGSTVGAFMTSFFGGGSIIIIVILLILMIAGLVVGDRAWDSFSEGRPLTGLIFLAIIIGGVLFYLSGGLDILGLTMPGVDTPTELPFDIDQDTLILIGIMIFFVIVIWWMIGGPRLRGVEIVPRF